MSDKIVRYRTMKTLENDYKGESRKVGSAPDSPLCTGCLCEADITEGYP